MCHPLTPPSYSPQEPWVLAPWPLVIVIGNSGLCPSDGVGEAQSRRMGSGGEGQVLCTMLGVSGDEGPLVLMTSLVCLGLSLHDLVR